MMFKTKDYIVRHIKELFTPLLTTGRGWGWVFLFVLASCARIGTPDGGWFDDTPPRVVSSTPIDRGTKVKAKRVAINFNEYIKIEDIQNKVIVSPPQIEQPEIKATGKRIVIDLVDSLKENTTYTIDFSDAITDNNEGNPMGNYTFSFSTGTEIDTFQVSGYCLNAEDLEPIKGILVGLYTDSTFTDSTFHTQPMERVARTNGIGQFTIKGVAPGSYYVYALKDADGDFLYGQKSETIGYSHEAISPAAKPDMRQDTIWMDSLHISNILQVGFTHFLPDDVTLLCYQAPQTDRFLIKTERKEPEKLGFFFSYGNDSLPRLRGLNFDADSAFVIEPSAKNDTVYYWLRDTALINTDTLRIEAVYQMTDSTGLLVEKVDSCIEFLPKVPYAKRLKEQLKQEEKWLKEQEKKKKREEPYDSIMPIPSLKAKLNVTNRLDPYQDIVFEFPTPLSDCQEDSIHLYSMIDSVWYRTPFELSRPTVRQVILRADWQLGAEYSLEVDTMAFQDIYGLTSKPIKQGFKVRTNDEYSTLQVNLSGISDSCSYLVQLLNNSGRMVRQEVVENGTAEFYYVKPQRYFLRAIADWNGNGQWDTGDYDAGLQAEPVYYFHEEIECKAKWDVSRDWNITQRPRYRQKPAAITKAKPDQQKQLRDRNTKRALDKGIQYIPKN